MNCSELEQMLCPYLDGEFGAADRMEVEGHLAGCPDCARRVHHEAAFRSALRAKAQAASAELVAPAALRARITDAIHREQRVAFGHRALPYAAAAAVVVLAGTAYQLSRQPIAKRSFLEDAAARHAKNLPVEVRVGDPSQAAEQLEPWFDDKLDHRVHVPRLSNATVVGGRLSNLRDRDAAYISYETTTGAATPRRVGVFVVPDHDRDFDVEPLPHVEVDQTRGYNVAIWRDDEIVYGLVTDLDEADIRRMLADPDTLEALGSSGSTGFALPPPAPPVTRTVSYER